MNQFERDLIDDPPQKNPYFTKPDVANFLTKQDLDRAADAEKSRFNSLIDLFGMIDKMTDEQSTQFLLQVIRHSKFQPDFEAVANALNIANSHHVDRRFQTIIRQHGFEYDKKNGSIRGKGSLPKNTKPARASVDDFTKLSRQPLRRGRSAKSLNKDEGSMTGFNPLRKKVKLGLVHTRPDCSDDTEEAADVEDNGDEGNVQHEECREGSIAVNKDDTIVKSAKIHGNTGYHAANGEENPDQTK